MKWVILFSLLLTTKIFSLPIIITGGHGAGKTTIIEALEKRNYHIGLESARIIIEEKGVRPDVNPKKFNKLVFEMEVDKLINATTHHHEKLVFFDRGLGDMLGYHIHFDAHEDEIMNLHQRISEFKEHYHPIVFIAPFWPEIYKNDNARKESAQEAERLFGSLAKAYKQLGFTVCLIPTGNIDERIEYILENKDHCPESYLL